MIGSINLKLYSGAAADLVSVCQKSESSTTYMLFSRHTLDQLPLRVFSNFSVMTFDTGMYPDTAITPLLPSSAPSSKWTIGQDHFSRNKPSAS